MKEIEPMRKKLEEHESFLYLVLEGIGEGVVVIDRNFKIFMANRGYCSQVKMSCDEIIGKHCYEVSHHLSKPCYENGEECSVKEAFETGSSHRIIHTHFDKENKPIYIETVSYPLKDKSGNIVYAIEVLTDITQRFLLEQNLKNKVKELEEFYDMAVGRELRMVELKEEMERLREKLKKHKNL
ncbi:MAG: PAS domain-containing protein [Nitrospirota bacterium]|nr:PAS domain-containing protein [Nitrospirota bacterium]